MCKNAIFGTLEGRHFARSRSFKVIFRDNVLFIFHWNNKCAKSEILYNSQRENLILLPPVASPCRSYAQYIPIMNSIQQAVAALHAAQGFECTESMASIVTKTLKASCGT